VLLGALVTHLYKKIFSKFLCALWLMPNALLLLFKSIFHQLIDIQEAATASATTRRLPIVVTEV
jgi:hypothetical protein